MARSDVHFGPTGELIYSVDTPSEREELDENLPQNVYYTTLRVEPNASGNFIVRARDRVSEITQILRASTDSDLYVLEWVTQPPTEVETEHTYPMAVRYNRTDAKWSLVIDGTIYPFDGANDVAVNGYSITGIAAMPERLGNKTATLVVAADASGDAIVKVSDASMPIGMTDQWTVTANVALPLSRFLISNGSDTYFKLNGLELVENPGIVARSTDTAIPSRIATSEDITDVTTDFTYVTTIGGVDYSRTGHKQTITTTRTYIVEKDVNNSGNWVTDSNFDTKQTVEKSIMWRTYDYQDITFAYETTGSCYSLSGLYGYGGESIPYFTNYPCLIRTVILDHYDYPPTTPEGTNTATWSTYFIAPARPESREVWEISEAGITYPSGLVTFAENYKLTLLYTYPVVTKVLNSTTFSGVCIRSVRYIDSNNYIITKSTYNPSDYIYSGIDKSVVFSVTLAAWDEDFSTSGINPVTHYHPIIEYSEEN